MAFGAGLTRGAQPLTHRTIETLRSAEAPVDAPGNIADPCIHFA